MRNPKSRGRKRNVHPLPSPQIQLGWSRLPPELRNHIWCLADIKHINVDQSPKGRRFIFRCSRPVRWACKESYDAIKRNENWVTLRGCGRHLHQRGEVKFRPESDALDLDLSRCSLADFLTFHSGVDKIERLKVRPVWDAKHIHLQLDFSHWSHLASLRCLVIEGGHPKKHKEITQRLRKKGLGENVSLIFGAAGNLPKAKTDTASVQRRPICCHPASLAEEQSSVAERERRLALADERGYWAVSSLGVWSGGRWVLGGEDDWQRRTGVKRKQPFTGKDLAKPRTQRSAGKEVSADGWKTDQEDVRSEDRIDDTVISFGRYCKIDS